VRRCSGKPVTPVYERLEYPEREAELVQEKIDAQSKSADQGGSRAIMSNGNTVVLIGNITRDPELRFTPTGQPTTTFGLAVNRRWQNRQTQEWEESTSFFDIVCWREMAENASESLVRGARVIVCGRLEQRSWETPDGEKRSKIEVIADEIGPSLRWATAQIVRNERRTVQMGGAEPSQKRSASQPAESDPGPYDDITGRYELIDEEPF